MKKVIVTASCLIIVGIILCISASLIIDFDFGRLDTNMYITNTYEFTEEINKISIDCNTADIEILTSEDSTAKVIWFDKESRKQSVTLTDGTLRIEREDKAWYKNLTLFSFKTPVITLYLPQKDYDSLSIRSATGDISINDLNFATLAINTTTSDLTLRNINATKLNLIATTGDAKLSNIVATELYLKTTTGDMEFQSISAVNAELNGTTGNITLTDCHFEGNLKVQTTTGDINLNNSDAGIINCKTTTGNITGTLLTEKVFKTHSSTGDIQVPSSVNGGECELQTTTGNIRIKVVSE